MTIKQMNEKQLAQWFKQTRKASEDSFVSLNSFSEASDERLAMAESIADSNLHSATQKAMNEMQDWNQSMSKSVENQQNSRDSWFEKIVMPFMRPAMAMAFVAGFVVVLMNENIHQGSMDEPTKDHIMFNSSFDLASDSQNDVISNTRFELDSSEDTIKSFRFDSSHTDDKISSVGFG